MNRPFFSIENAEISAAAPLLPVVRGEPRCRRLISGLISRFIVQGFALKAVEWRENLRGKSTDEVELGALGVFETAAD